VHRWDPHTPLEETLRGLDDLVRQGKIGYVGVSDFAAWQLAKIDTMAELKGWTAVTAIQSEYHLLKRDIEAEVLPYCQTYNVAFIPYYPLAGGFLTGKYRRGEPPPPGSRGESNARVQAFMTDAQYDVIEALTAWAKARGHGLNELAQAWLMAQPQVCSVISGASRLDHVLSNVKAADWLLNDEDRADIDAILRPSQRS
jgi:aryl-alcohol dehydrogenase-like predicted oxidoreductase